MTLEPLLQLSTSSLLSLASSLREGALSSGITKYALQQIAGNYATELGHCLQELLSDGSTASQVARLVEAMAETRQHIGDPSLLIDLVLSGPDVPGIPTGDTAATMRALIEDATSEILLIGYAVHNGQQLFAPLAAKMLRTPVLRVGFCLDIGRKPTDTSLASEIVRRFAKEFRSKHWPWPVLPELHYDPRSIEQSTDKRSSLHAKCVIVDRRVALVTSANFTEAAQQRNIEVGLLVKHAPVVQRLAGYFEALQKSGQLVRFHLE